MHQVILTKASEIFDEMRQVVPRESLGNVSKLRDITSELLVNSSAMYFQWYPKSFWMLYSLLPSFE